MELKNIERLSDKELRIEIKKYIDYVALRIYGRSNRKHAKAYEKFIGRYYLDHDEKICPNFTKDGKVFDSMSRNELEKGYTSAINLVNMYKENDGWAIA